MPFQRLWRVIQGQGGSALIELLVAMPIAVLLVGIVVQSLGVSGKRQSDVERRTEALSQGQIGLERMTRELRQAEWVFFQSSSVVDMDALVRPNPTAHGVQRHVRYDCSGTSCIRLEGPAVSFPPSAASTFDSSIVIVGAPPGDTQTRYGTIVGHNVFEPARVDSTTGATVPDFMDPDIVLVRLQLAVQGRRQPIEIRDGVSLRNRSTFQ